LEFVSWGGLPGPFIKWFLKSLGTEGLYNMLAKFDKKARAIATFAYCAGPGEPVTLFEGITDGEIVFPRGPGTFGWDPVFQPDGFDQTYAEMRSELKNSISHRYKALQKLKAFLEEQGQL
jgi:inosine triphosphate pyrophosphatase